MSFSHATIDLCVERNDCMRDDTKNARCESLLILIPAERNHFTSPSRVRVSLVNVSTSGNRHYRSNPIRLNITQKYFYHMCVDLG